MFVDLIKSTSLLVTISAAELMTEAQLIASETFRALEVYLVIAAIYFAVCYPVSQCLLWLERSIQAGVPLSLDAGDDLGWRRPSSRVEFRPWCSRQSTYLQPENRGCAACGQNSAGFENPSMEGWCSAA